MNGKLAVFSWALYDFANTIFSMNIISLYFALWVTVDKKGEDILYSTAISISLILMAITMPIIGSISDRIGRRKPFLIFFTMMCSLFIGLMGFVESLWLGLAIFVAANYGYQLGGLFYNTLLPYVSTTQNIGKVSGYGVSFGYVGTILGLLLVKPFVMAGGHQAAFLPTGVLFLLFALPCFIFVKEEFDQHEKRRLQNKSHVGPGVSSLLGFEGRGFSVRETVAQLWQTTKGLREMAGLKNYFIASFACLCALNTIIVFMSVYAKKVFGLDAKDIITFFIVSACFAIVSAFCYGFVTDRLGSRRALSIALAGWCVTLLIVMFCMSPRYFWIVGPLAGVCLGPTWVSARPLLIALAPPKKLAQFFGLYGFIGLFSTICGTMTWGLVVWIFSPLGMWKYRIAVFVLAVFMATGWSFLQKIPEQRKRSAGKEGQALA